jgi:hypothetical protein
MRSTTCGDMPASRAIVARAKPSSTSRFQLAALLRSALQVQRGADVRRDFRGGKCFSADHHQ